MGKPEGDFALLEDIRKTTSRPVMAIVPYVTPEEMKESKEATKKFQARGVPAFPSTERGARALRNALDYYRHKNGVFDS